MRPGARGKAPALACGIALVVAAATPRIALGQEVPRDTAVVDTAATDTTIVPDSVRVAVAPRIDTIKAPLPHAELPVSVSIGEPYRWNRSELFATGAQSLLELLDLIPGVTTYRSGWLASPKIASFLGDPTRVRVFLDGLEITSLNPRTGGVLDVSDLQLWTLESVVVERGADEVRVYARTWRVDRTATSTRTDVFTGDQNTNVFRGFFGKRLARGEALQFAGQQYGVGGNLVGGGDELTVLGRVGWARGVWSVDAFGTRASLTRDRRDRADQLGFIPGLEAKRTDAYVRGLYGSPDSGFWAMGMVGAQRFDEETPSRTAPIDSVDTLRTSTQYVAALGFARGGARVSLTNRLVRGDDDLFSVTGRASYIRGPLALSLYAEQRGGDSSSVEEASAVLRPLSFVALSGAVSHRHGGMLDDAVVTARAEVGVRLGRVWATGGVVRQEEHLIPGLVVFDTTFAPATLPTSMAVFGTLRGKFYRDLGVDVSFLRWQDSAFYRPLQQGRAELFLETRWLSRFPSGNFGFLGSIAYEYRSRTLFPALPPGGKSPIIERLGDQHMGVARVEFRLLDAVLFYQQHFAFYPPNRATLPGYLFPRQLQLYGVRWQFWN